MLADFIIVNKKLKTPIYIQIYREIKKAIENGQIKEKEKLPSVRSLCVDLDVSKTTVESAYVQLCIEGYIINKPQSGYFVEKGILIKNKTQRIENNSIIEKNIYKYDFSGRGIDNNCSNIREWKKYVKDILNKEYLLNTYSENQGEEELRKVIEKYSFNVRGVSTGYNNIVIGSGSQTLIYILCGLMGINKTVAIEKDTYPQAEKVFKDFNYNVLYTDNDDKGITIKSLNKINPDILLINPNIIGKNGMPITRKIEIINWAKDNNCLVIEDDYNGELRYKTRPTPCIQSYGTDCTVYIGSFSRILLPSVRISYMVLPENLLDDYNKVKDLYNQTTSKTEQLALAKYISEGKLEKHLRKARRYYNTKSEIMLKALKDNKLNYKFNETSMYFEVNMNIENPVEYCKSYDIGIMATSSKDKVRLSFAQIESELIEKGIETLSKMA